jgi:amino acid permease
MIEKLFSTVLGGMGIIVTTDYLIIQFNILSIILLIIFSIIFAYGFVHLKESIGHYLGNQKERFMNKFRNE